MAGLAPSSFISTMCRPAKIANTETMTVAALVTVPAERRMPTRTASRVGSPARTDSRWLLTNTW